METVTVTETVDAGPDRIREVVTDVGALMRAVKFEDVRIDGNIIEISNHVGLATIELPLEMFDNPDAILAYEQRDGIFDDMVTRYFLAETATGVEVTATTEFAIQARLGGPLLDATVVSRQRRRELTAQFDHLARDVE
jgi:hypothetical protein